MSSNSGYWARKLAWKVEGASVATMSSVTAPLGVALLATLNSNTNGAANVALKHLGLLYRVCASNVFIIVC